MEKKKLKLLVCCHKADSLIRTEDPYVPIQVGKALHPDLDLGFINDNEGVNISDKNQRWCELTALYWGWKNIKDVEYLGLCHYRRYFDCTINDSNIDKMMRNIDILLLSRVVESCSVATRFKELVTMEDFYIFIDAFLNFHPEYEKAILNYCFNSNLFYPCTMFLARKEVYDNFCEVIFPVLEEVERKSKTHNYSRLNRNIAYMGELSLGIYVTHNKLKTKMVPMKEYGTKCQTSLPDSLLYIYRGYWKIRKRIGFLIMSNHSKKINIYDAVLVGLRSDGIDVAI